MTCSQTPSTISTERAYVKYLQEVYDIYIKPCTLPETVNLLSDVSQREDSVPPASERKLVFYGLETIMSFHKECILPALEHAAAPVLGEGVDTASSAEIANAVGDIFLGNHVEFTRIYSNYTRYAVPCRPDFCLPLSVILEMPYSVSKSGRIVPLPLPRWPFLWTPIVTIPRSGLPTGSKLPD